MVGGLFQGSNDNATWTTLYTVTATPTDAWKTILLSTNPKTLRYLRYLAPNGSYGDVAEIEFDSGVAPSAVKLTGTGFGTAGSYNNLGNVFSKALDGNTSTYFDAPAPGNGDYVGIDQGAAPANLAATAGNACVSLTWNSVSGASSYNVYRGTTSGGPYVPVNSSSVASCLDTGLNNSTTYYYVVTAVSGTSESGYSSPVSVMPLTSAPTWTVAAPASLMASPGDGSVSLSWTAVSGATGYTLYRATTSGGPYSYVTNLASTQTTFMDSNNAGYLANGTYYYVVTAKNNGGASAYSTQASVTLSVGIPTGLTATAGDGVISLSWNALAGADSFALYRATASGGPYTFVVNLANTQTTFTDSNGGSYLPNGTYYYVLTARNNGGVSANSTQASVTLSVGIPTGLTATAGDGVISLSWNALAGADSFALYRATASGGPYTFVVNLANTQTTFTDSNGGSYLPNGTYYYVLTARNNGGVSAYSSQASITLSIAAPDNLKASLAANGVQLSWTAVSGADSYTLYRATTSGGPYSYVANLASTPTTFTDGSLPNGNYFYVIIARNNGGASGYSQEASVTVIPVVSSIVFGTNPVLGGNPSTGTIYMTGVSQTATVVNLAGNSASATVPANVTVPAGQSYANFSISTTAVTAIVSDTVTATYAGLATQANLSIVPLLGSVTFNPNPVAGGSSAAGYASLNGPAPAGGATITLSSDNMVAPVPANVTIPAGQSYIQFSVTTAPVAAPVTANITAKYSGATTTNPLTVNPLGLLSLSLSPNSVTGGNAVSGTVTLNGTAPTGGIIVSLKSDNNSATVPANVTVLAGASSAVFNASTSVVTTVTVANLSAGYNGVTKGASLSVSPTALASVTVNVPQVTGGNSATGTVTLTGPAPTGGDTITLMSSNNQVASVPTTVVVAAGQTSVTFPISTVIVTTSTSVTLTASYAGANMTAGLTVLPIYMLTATAANVTVSISGGELGASTSSTLTATAGNVIAASIPVSLGFSALPTGVTGWLSSNVATIPPAIPANNWNAATPGKTTATLYFVAGPSASPGPYSITVTATDGSYSISTVVTLTITP